jgi:hypothetical protein
VRILPESLMPKDKLMMSVSRPHVLV